MLKYLKFCTDDHLITTGTLIYNENSVPFDVYRQMLSYLHANKDALMFALM